MHVVALDIGDRRVGIARTDPTGSLAIPHATYTRRSFTEDVAALAGICRELGAAALVVGLPLNMDGTEGEQACKVRKLAEAVAQESGTALYYLDERWTTEEAARAQREAGASPRKIRPKLDELAAVLILQAWLEHNRPRSE